MNSVTSTLVGGLGNQMFQYAVARTTALRLGASLKLDLRKLLAHNHRAYGLGDFALSEVDLIREGTLAADPPRFIQQLPRWLTGSRFFCEKTFSYDARILSVRTPIELHGYFQSERYFAAQTAQLRADFKLKASLADEIDRLAKALIPAEPSVALHVRRGDYTTPVESAFHGLLGQDYYERAMKIVRERCGVTPLVCVFTDDPAWVRGNLTLPANTQIISEHTQSPLQDLILMSRCTHHIIANSSFSWWGAWLNPSPDKIVVMPKQWFSPEIMRTFDVKDLRPAAWVEV